MSFDRRLHEKVSNFTVYPGRGAPFVKDEALVLAQPGDSLEVAFDLARGLLRSGQVVRLVGPGVTCEQVWPAWVRSEEKIALTEWGAFRVTSELEATRELQGEFRRWVGSVFDNDFGGQAPERIFFAAGCARFFEASVKAYPIATAMASLFPKVAIWSVRDQGTTAVLLSHLIEGQRGRPHDRQVPRRSRLPWRAQIFALGAAGILASLQRVTVGYVRGGRTRRAIAARRKLGSSEVPRAWVALLPDWHRMNHQLLDGFALPETEDGGELGVLFVGTLAPHDRGEPTSPTGVGTRLWPGLGPLGDRLSRCSVEQAVMPSRPGAFARAAARGVMRSIRALRKLSKSDVVTLPTIQFTLTPGGVVRWATLDVMRATLSQAAAREFLARASMQNTTVLFVAGNQVAWTPVDLALRDAGATTVDHLHGWSADTWSAHTDSEASVRVVWTRPDVDSASSPGSRIVVAGMPLRPELRPRNRAARNVLLMTNYTFPSSEQDVGFVGGANSLPLRIFQSEIFDTLPQLRDLGHHDLEFRWRPHPVDNLLTIRNDLARCKEVGLSRGVPLDEDLAWADLIITTVSTVTLESMFAGVPVFVHVLPELWGLPATRFLAPERMFFHASEGARLVASWLRQYGKTPSEGLDAEKQARIILFGPHGVPEPMTAYFGRNARRPIPE